MEAKEANKLQWDQQQTLRDEHMHQRRGKAGGWRERTEATKGNGQDSETRVVGPGQERERRRRSRRKKQGGQIPGLCAPDEFEFMWQWMSLRNVYVNPTHTHKNRQEHTDIKRIDYPPPPLPNFLSLTVLWMKPIGPNALCFNHSVEYYQWKHSVMHRWKGCDSFSAIGVREWGTD